ncbi:MAG: hypothetical protein IJZ85_11625 [Lachnospiraceae bacterium]|nr:hypothetical protein [Lachnospiraceae bacterium]
MNRIFPYPDREHSRVLLEEDAVYFKIPENDRDMVFDLAWNAGVDAARELIAQKEGKLDFFRILEEYGLKLKTEDIDNVAGNIRFYSEIFPRAKEVKLYLKSVKLWAKQTGVGMRDGQQLILAHEFFHYLEHAKLGFTSKKYQVYMLKIGKFELGKTGIPSLSEIGANAFAIECLPYLDLEINREPEEDETEYLEEKKEEIDFKRHELWKGAEP